MSLVSAESTDPVTAAGPAGWVPKQSSWVSLAVTSLAAEPLRSAARRGLHQPRGAPCSATRSHGHGMRVIVERVHSGSAGWSGQGGRERPTHVTAVAERAIERGLPRPVRAVVVHPICDGALRVIAQAAEVVCICSVSPLGHSKLCRGTPSQASRDIVHVRGRCRSSPPIHFGLTERRSREGTCWRAADAARVAHREDDGRSHPLDQRPRWRLLESLAGPRRDRPHPETRDSQDDLQALNARSRAWAVARPQALSCPPEIPDGVCRT